MKTIRRYGREWAWPDYDTKLLQVFDEVHDIDIILGYVHGHGGSQCVQAGGACGVWPQTLLGHFAEVHTFEPDAQNYACLSQNVDRLEWHGDTCHKMHTYNAALGAVRGVGTIKRHETEQTNAGAGYVQAGDDFPVVTIDDLRLTNCALIQLDIEGSERDALLGAYFTLYRQRPVVVIEEKHLPQEHHPDDHLRARRFLEQMGYKERARIHRDVVFSC